LGNLSEWGRIIAYYLIPEGQFVIIKFHPVLWMLDEDFQAIKYAYSKDEPYIQTESTYTENGEDSVSETVNWSYGMAELLKL